MKKDFKQLLEPIILNSGTKLNNRIAMAPMVINASNEDGTVSDDDINFFSKRSDVAGLLITGSANISDVGYGFLGQISIAKDEDIEGLKKLVKAAKKDGNKVIVQLQHSGRGAMYHKLGRVVAPSSINFPFLNYIPDELTEQEIEETIQDFGRATERAIRAGFDGVEIHGANHYLLQQFFSKYSNIRTDKWGGTLEKRMAFPLAVVKEVNRVIRENQKEDFIVGYRITPEEIHGENIGYTYKESVQLADKLAEEKIDYLHLSMVTGYNSGPKDATVSYGELFKKVLNNRCLVMVVSNVLSVEDAVEALDHGDIIAIGRTALVEPQFTKKIKEERIQEIDTNDYDINKLSLPEKLVERFLMENTPLPPLPGIEKIKESLKK